MRTLVQDVEAYAQKYNMLQRGDRVLVGLSGGADSVCLLYVLKELGEKQGFLLFALHVNHGIRGAEADADERFAEELCGNLSVPFFAVREEAPYYAAKNRVSLEEAGRILRHEALRRTAEAEGFTKIALAHHANDSAETMLFHLFRGSRLAGLAGIPPVRGAIIRPLLCCKRKEIEAWLLERGICYRTDSTNLSEDYTRNKIRRRILNVAEEEINPQAAAHMQRTAEYIRQVQDYIKERQAALLSRTVQKKAAGSVVQISGLMEEAPFLREAVLYEVIAGLAGGSRDIRSEHVEAVCALLEKQSGRSVTLPKGIQVRRSYDTLVFEWQQEAAACPVLPEKEVAEVLVPGRYPCGEGKTLAFSAFPYEKTAEIPKNRYTKWYDYDKIKDSISLRARKEGDVIRINGGTKTIKALFIDEKVPKEKRSRLLLVACGGEILWAPGIRASDGYPVGEGTTRILQISLEENGGKKMDEGIKVLLSEEQVAARVRELAEQINKEYEGKSLHLICILKGSIFFTCELAKHLSIPVTMDFMSVSSYGNDTVSSGRVKIIKDLDEPIEGRDVLVIEDIVDSGRTLNYLLTLLSARQPASLKLCTLLDKPDRREVPVDVEYVGFEIPDLFVLGFGLDVAQKYRNLPYVGVKQEN